MRTSTVLASILFGSFAAAAPVDKRALVVHTEVVYETVVVFTTVYDDDVPAASPTPEGLFYEQPSSSSVVVASTSSAAPAVVKPSSIYVAAPAPQTPSPVPTTTAKVYTPEPAKPTTEAAKPTYEAPKPTPEAPKPTTTTEAAYVAPTTAAAVAAPVAASDSAPATTSGEQYSNVDITIYDNNGGFGACGTELHDTDLIAAIAQPAWGASTYDVMTGAATNVWCGQKAKVDYNGKSVIVTILDMCPGCVGNDLDLSLAAWTALGLTEKTRLKASWSKVS